MDTSCSTSCIQTTLALVSGISPRSPGCQYQHTAGFLRLNQNPSHVHMAILFFGAVSNPDFGESSRGLRNCHISRSPWTPTHSMTHPQESSFQVSPPVRSQIQQFETALSQVDNRKARLGAQASILRHMLSSLSVWGLLQPSKRTRESHTRNPCRLGHLTSPSMGRSPWPHEVLTCFTKRPSRTQTPTGAHL